MSTFERLRALWARAPTGLDDASAHSASGRAGSGRERRKQLRPPMRPGLRALVIDDSPTILAVLRRMLRQNGMDVLEAVDAEAGLELARAEPPDLVFLDIVLPGMSGFEALRVLRRDPATCQLPVIMISGNAQATEQFYVQRIGADDFLRKPFARADVFGSIARLIDAEGVPRRIDTLRETQSDEDAAALPLAT